jgi:hypothetical protein
MFSFHIRGCALHFSADFICFLLIITLSSSLSPHHHSSPSQPISSTLGKCYPSITLPFGRQSNPFLSWCETNTSQRARQTRRIKFKLMFVSAFMQVQFPSFVLLISATSSAVKSLPPGPLGLLIAELYLLSCHLSRKRASRRAATSNGKRPRREATSRAIFKKNFKKDNMVSFRRSASSSLCLATRRFRILWNCIASMGGN